MVSSYKFQVSSLKLAAGFALLIGCFVIDISGTTSWRNLSGADIATAVSETSLQCSGADDSAGLTAAVTAAAEGIVVVRKGQTCAGSDVKLANVRVEQGGLLKPVTGHAITITGVFDAGVYQTFTNATAGLGTVSFAGNKTIGDFRGEWWGAVPDGSTDNFAALSAMVAAGKTASRSYKFQDGTYNISDTLVLSGLQGYHLSGENELTTLIRITTANRTGVLINHGSYGVIERLGFTTNVASSSAYALLDLDSTSPVAITGATNANPTVVSAVGHGFSTGDSVTIAGVGGNTGVNGTWTITRLTSDTFSIPVNTSGGSAYTSSGAVQLGRLKTQQVSLRDTMFQCQNLAATGLRISKSGGSAQGDTILVSKPLVIGCTDSGISVGYSNAQNALGITIENGDIQGCYRDGIAVTGGQIFANGTSFQNQDQGVLSADGVVLSQITQNGADLHIYSGAGVSGRSSMKDIRSESDVLAIGGGEINHASLNAGSQDQWFANSFYNFGQLIKGTPGVGNKGQDGRTFMLVDTTGTRTFVTPDADSTTSLIKDASRTWTVNQWAGGAYYLALRYPNGHVAIAPIASNTATALALGGALPYDFHNDSSVCGFGQRYDCSQYRIVGITGSTEPTWTSAPHGYFNPYHGQPSNGISISSGTNVATGSYYGFGNAGLSAGDYILIFGAGKNGGPFISRLTAFSHPSGSTAQATLADNASTTVTDAGGYMGTPITDGQAKWIDVDFNALSGAFKVDQLYTNGGRLGAAAVVNDSSFVRPDFIRQNNSQSLVRSIRNVFYLPGDYNTGPGFYVPDFTLPGTDVASASTITPSGNVFTITGTTTVSTISTATVQPGTVLVITTAGAVTFNEAGNIDISGAAASLTSSAGSLVLTVWDGTKWRMQSASPTGSPTNSLTDNGTTIATDARLGNNFRVTALTANVTLSNPTNSTDGQVVTWEIIQNASAAKTLAYGTDFAFGSEITRCTISTTTSSHNFLTAIYNSTTSKWYVRGCLTGY